LSFNVILGKVATRPTAWPAKDSVTLVEYALHYVADNLSNPGIAKVSSGLASIAVIPGRLAGKDVARIEMSADGGAKLMIYLILDGNVISFEAVQ
jgi:hypothetical protein